MSIVDFLSNFVSTVLRLILWTAAALMALVVVSLGLVALLAWVLVNLVMGRKPHLGVRSHFQNLRQFSGAFGAGSFRSGGLWPQQAPEESQGSSPGVNPAAGSLARRPQADNAVVDVESRDLPANR